MKYTSWNTNWPTMTSVATAALFATVELKVTGSTVEVAVSGPISDAINELD
jgi:hypothetical protein